MKKKKIRNRTVHKLLTNPLSFIGIVLISFFIVIAVIAPWITKPEYANRYIIPRDGYSSTPQPPSVSHPLGTTEGQYDIFYGIVWGTRTAFRIGLLVVAGIVLIGVTLGAIAGYYGGIVDEIIMRLTDIFLTFPFLVAAMVMVVLLGRGLNHVMIALVVFGWMGYARMIRGDVLAIKEIDYVAAARALGASDLRIIFRHVLPNAIYPVFVMSTMDIGSMVLTAAALSFLGLGSQVGYADWGQMISFARNWILGTDANPFAYWYTVIYPGLAIVLFVLGWNLVGDAFRDILDPRMRGSR